MSKPNYPNEMVVLVVDDESLIRKCIVSYLRKSGCLVLEALSGAQAIEMLSLNRRIDAVFTDIRLRGRINGWEIAEACRSIRKDIAVIYTSGHSIEAARRLPGSMLFKKPYSSEQILEACQSLCSAAPMSRPFPECRRIEA